MKLKTFKNYKELVTRSPRRYCKYAVTKRPANVTGIKPKTIPDKSGSTIFKKVLKSDFELNTIYIYSNYYNFKIYSKLKYKRKEKKILPFFIRRKENKSCLFLKKQKFYRGKDF